MSVKALAGTRSKTPSRLHVFAEGLKEPSPHQNVSCDPQHQWHKSGTTLFPSLPGQSECEKWLLRKVSSLALVELLLGRRGSEYVWGEGRSQKTIFMQN